MSATPNLQGTGKFSSAAALLSISSLAIRILGLVTTSVLARILTPSDYGIVALGLTATGLFDVLTNLQVAGSLIRTPELSDEHLRSAFTINFIRGAIACALIFLLSDVISLILGESRLAPILRSLSLGPLLIGLQNPAFIHFEKRLQFRPEIIRAIVAAVFGTAVSILVAITYRSYWALVAGTITATGMQTLMTYWRVPIRVGFSTRYFREMLDFGGWLALVSIIEYLNSKVDILLIGKGLGTRLLGAYQAGGQVVAAATSDVVGPLVRAIFPALAMSRSAEELRAKYIRMQALILSLALPIGMGISAIAPQVVRLFLGGQWVDAIPVIQLLGPLSALQTVLATVDAVAMSTGQTKQLFRRTSTVFMVRVTLLLIGFHFGGFIGILFARVLSGTFYLIYGLHLAARLTDTKPWAPLIISWRSIISVIGMYLAVRFATFTYDGLQLPQIHLMILIALYVIFGGFVYLSLHTMLWMLSGKPASVESTILEHLRSTIFKVVKRR